MRPLVVVEAWAGVDRRRARKIVVMVVLCACEVLSVSKRE